MEPTKLAESLEAFPPPELWQEQPSSQSLVWQANQLSVARYQLSEIEQKLLLYAISMIDGKDVAFKQYRIHVAAYAEMCGVPTNALYAQLRTAAESIAAKPLVLAGHKAEDGKTVDLLTHWFSEVEFGSGYIDVLFPRSLQPYLIGVKREFYKFKLQVPLHLSGEYSLRLYQLCKRWQFGRRKIVTVRELRVLLGLIEWDQGGKPSRERLPKYGDMKKWAILPALAEMKRSSDILVRMNERKKPGTKLVEAIEFTILDNPDYTPPPGVLRLKDANPVVDLKATESLDMLQDEFGLSAEQARMAVAKHGVAYVEAKAEVVRSKPRENAAASMLTALEKDWQPSKRIGKKVSAKQATVKQLPAPAELVQTSLPLPVTNEDFEKARAMNIQYSAALREKWNQPQEPAPAPVVEGGPKYPVPTKKQIAERKRRKKELLQQAKMIQQAEQLQADLPQ